MPVSDTDEVALHESAVPRNTKVTTEWGIRVWRKCSAQRATCFPANGLGIVSVTTPLLEMPPVDLSYWMGSSGYKCARKTAVSTRPSYCKLWYAASSVSINKMVFKIEFMAV